jgi:hypothetical protein
MVFRIRRPSKGAIFIHPIDSAMRTVILAAGFRDSKLVRAFPQGWNERAKRFAPGSVAGPLEQLRNFMSSPWPLEQAVVVFTYADGPTILPPDRESLWQAFGVPVFEQFLSPENRLLATECDAHSGLHVVSGCEGFTLDHEICPCGNPAPRLSRGSRIDELAGLLA